MLNFKLLLISILILFTLSGCTPTDEIILEDHSVPHQVINFSSAGIFFTETGFMFYTDSKGDTHILQADGTTIDRLRSNVILNEVDMSYFSNSTGVYLNVSSIDGTTIKINLGGTQKNTGVVEYIILLNSGTSTIPVVNLVYLYNISNVTVGITDNEQDLHLIDHVILTRILLGNFTNTEHNIYGSSKEDDSVQNFLHNINDRLYHDGLIYLSGFTPSISLTQLNISVGEYYSGLFKINSPNNLTLSDGAYLVNSSGHFINFNSTSEITKYSDTGGLIGNAKYYNLVWGIVTTNGDAKLIALIQKEPDTEYNTVDIALTDKELKLVDKPSIEILKNNFLPIARTVVQKNTNEFELIAGSDRFIDLR